MPLTHPRRPEQYAIDGMVATSQSLAAQAGIHMMRSGGTAADAAIATAIALTVVEPTSNGIGGDAFAMVWDGEEMHGLNGSGRSPKALTPELLAERGLESMPAVGWLPVTVPGAPRAWADLHERFGRLPFAKLFEPAVHYAERGFPVTPVVARNWRIAAADYRAHKLPRLCRRLGRGGGSRAWRGVHGCHAR